MYPKMITYPKNYFNHKVTEQLDNVLSLVDTKCLIAGGSIVSLLTNTSINDYDIYTDNPQKVMSVLITSTTYLNIYETDNATTITRLEKEKIIKYQIVNTINTTDPSILLKTFDFICCSICYDGINFYANKQFLSDLLGKTLTLNEYASDRFSFKTYKRMIKYMKKGFYPDYDTQYKILEIIKEKGIPDKAKYVLQDY
jgi:hypothetical protein